MKKYLKLLISVFLFLFSSYFMYTHNKVYGVDMVMKEYKTTLDLAKQDENYKEEYKKFYEDINYHEEENFIIKINTFLNLGYDAEEINEIYDFLNEKNIEKLLVIEKQDLKKYYTIPNFEVDKIHEYEEYQRIYNCSLEEAIIKVNIGLNHDFYTEIKEVEKIEEYTVLVNKYHSLGDYEPNDLKSLSYDEKYKLREKAADAFEKLISYATLEGIYIRPYSAYRSFQYQTSIYNTYIERDGKEIADTYSARPGHSEHQTGLAVDVWSMGCEYIKEEDAKWLKNNAHKFGFIIRYTKENENITGYIEEPWHLRFLGVDVATDIVEKNITFDEYYDLYLKS